MPVFVLAAIAGFYERLGKYDHALAAWLECHERVQNEETLIRYREAGTIGHRYRRLSKEEEVVGYLQESSSSLS